MSQKGGVLRVKGLDKAISDCESLIRDAEVCKGRVEALLGMMEVKISGDPVWEMFMECERELAVAKSKIQEGKKVLGDLQHLRGLEGEEMLAAVAKIGNVVIAEWDR
jgi:hypothetical protein